MINSSMEDRQSAIFCCSSGFGKRVLMSLKKSLNKLTEALYISLPHKYNQISPPYMSKTEWKSHWVSLNKNVGIAYTQGFDQAENDIKSDWSAIMKMKGLKVLRE